jgi:3-oxoacyl-[acyl-carrier protein] reductase
MRALHAVVTGGGSGIGAAIATALANEGVQVTLMGRTLTRLQSLQLPGALCVACDVADAASVQSAFDAAAERGPIDILVNNAGEVESQPFLRTSPALWQRLLDVNLTGTFLCTKQVLPGMVERGFGRIVNMSARAWLGSAGQANYSAAKGAIVSLTRSLALEFASKGVTVNSIAPGIVDTPLFRNFKPEVQERLKTTVPVKRIGTTDDVALAVEFFLDPAASYVTGQTLYVCGGRSLAGHSV